MIKGYHPRNKRRKEYTMVKEEWVKDYADGTYATATVEHLGGEYFVDMGCGLWNRFYKSYAWAKRYLLKNGYAKMGTLITIDA